MAANNAVEQEVIVAAIVIALFIFTRFWYTLTHFQSKQSSNFAQRPTPQGLLQNLHAHNTWILLSSNSWATN